MTLYHDATPKWGFCELAVVNSFIVCIYRLLYLDFFLVLGTPRGERSPLEPEGSKIKES